MIVLIFALSFIPENFRDFFGDWHCNGGTVDYEVDRGYFRTGCRYNTMNENHGATWHWGFRHWLWMFSGLSLFVWNLFEILESYRKDKLL